MKYHAIYTVNGKVSDEDVVFDTVQQCEAWLDGLGATYYEIGLSSEAVTELRMKREMKKKGARMYQQLTIVGRLGRDPELRYTPTGTAVCTFNVATDKVWLKDDVKQEETTWHRVTTWKAQAENCAKYLAKGSMVLVTGTVKANAYTPKNGGDPAASLEVNAENVKFLTRAEADTMSGGNGTPVAAEQGSGSDIPF